jgi:phosphocarrier protein
MTEQEYVVQNNTGLHARPASRFVQKASTYKSKVRLRKGSREIDAKSIIGVLELSVRKGDGITIIAEGEDEENAVKELIELLDSLEE